VKVRNPISSLGVTLATSAFGAFLVGLPSIFVPYVELTLFYLVFAMFGVGLLAGRSSLLGSLGFAGAIVGGFAGSFLWQVFLAPALWPSGWSLLLALAYGGLCGLGGMATGKLGLRRVEKMVESLPKLRRCQRCGAKVGINAKKCWSCRAYLPPT